VDSPSANLFRRSGPWSIFALCALVFLAWTGGVDAADGERAKRVLMISTGSRFSSFPIAEQAVVDRLRELYRGELEFYSEYLDIVRFPSESYQRLFRDYLRDKYGRDLPDLIFLIFVGNLGTAGELLIELFPRAPLVVVGLTEEELSARLLPGRVTGVAQRSDPVGTIELILRLQPEIRRVVLIGGTAEVDRQVMSRAQEAARAYAPQVGFEVWDKRSMKDILTAASSLPPQTAILFTRMFRDGVGGAVNSSQAAQSIAKVSNVPVYVMTDTMLGTGAIGGSTVDLVSLGRRAGELADRILNGAEPKSLPLEIITQGIPVFDWRALKRWGISEDRLPPGSVVRFRAPSVWEQYRWYIVGALLIIALQAGLIADLLLHRSRRKRAEEKLRESEQNFRNLVETTAAIPWQADIETWVFTYVGPQAVKLLGYPLEQWYEKDFWVSHLHPEDKEFAMNTCLALSKSAEHFEFEYRTIAASGKTVWVHDIVNCERRNGTPTQLRGFMLDISARKQSEEALRESEERFRMMANTAPVMIWMSGSDKRCTFFNKGWLDFTGRTLEQELGDGWTEGVHRDETDRCLQIYANAFDARQEFTMEYRLRRSDGEYCWVLDHGVPRIEANGTFLGYIGTVIDISEIKRGEEKFRLAVEASANATVMVNDQGQIVLVNQQTEKLFGYSRDELIGQSLEMLVPERFRVKHPEQRAQFFAAPQTRALGAGRDLYARRKDGSEVLVEIGLNPIHTQEGLLVLVAIVDISARKQAEEALEKERAFLRQVIDIDPNFIFAKDRDGRFTLVNQAVADAYGTTVEDLVGKTDADFNPNRDEVVNFHRMDLEVIDNLQERFVPEEKLTDARGQIRWLQTVKRPIVDKHGVANQVLGASTDITMRKQAEAELRQQRDELAHLTRVSTMGELATSLAHELNQPLTAILSNAQAAQRFLAANPADLDEVNEILRDIVEDDNRASEVIRRLRAMVKKDDLKFSPLDLAALINDVALLVHSDAVLQNVRVSLELNPGLPPVRGDKVQLQQVMLNLLLNAFDAMKDCPPDKRAVSVKAEPDGAEKLKVSVADHGIGLTSDRIDKIFQPFYTTKREGLGMGLSISRSIIEAHGGRLWAENHPGRGATFYFTVPVEGVRGNKGIME
jgi:PAS domain S-box-containing protein